MKSCREGFGVGLADTTNDKVIVLAADLSKATKTDKFASKYPDRFIECGIQEANMIGTASGLASQGFLPVISSFGSFITGRYDQIRCSIVMPMLPVIIVGTHSGLSPGLDGPTQSAFEDLALMRALPGMTVYQPATYEESRLLIKKLTDEGITGPVYLRIGRQEVEELDTYSEEGFKYLRENMARDLIISTGCLLDTALEVARVMGKDLVTVSQIKPLPEIPHINEYRKVYVIEDHQEIGGLGSAICERYSEGKPRVRRIAIQDIFPGAGRPEDLYERYGLTVNQIISRIKCKR